MVRKPHADRSLLGRRNVMSHHGIMIILALATTMLLLGRKVLMLVFAVFMAVFLLGLYEVVEYMHRV
jgi:hypothetical protein